MRSALCDGAEGSLSATKVSSNRQRATAPAGRAETPEGTKWMTIVWEVRLCSTMWHCPPTLAALSLTAKLMACGFIA